MRHERQVRTTGFTLVEILVVTAIIAVLAAILLTVFARARESGRRTVCASNLKQIALAMQQYVGDNDGRYPGFGPLPDNWRHAISPYVKDAAIFRCPTFPAGYDWTENYTYNHRRLNVFLPPFPAKDITGVQESVLPNISTIF